MSRCFKYEEFCSLHDFIQVLQDVLGQSLSAVHISSCFTLKLDCSHQDWPVDVEWLKEKLHCTLSGSSKEVYETGSQVADLYISLSTLINPLKFNESLGVMLSNVIHVAKIEEFPDLAQEMGLEILSPEDVGRKALTPSTDEEVSAPSQVNSSVHVVILVGNDSNDEQSKETHHALANALIANLTMRQMSDIKCKYSLLPLHPTWKENLHSFIHSVLELEQKILFVALGSCWVHLNLLHLIRKEICSLNGPNCCYGIHFQKITSMQAYFLKTQLNDINSCSREAISPSNEKRHIVATALVKDEKSNPVEAFPVLLYIIHLAIGENGERISGKGLVPAHLKYRQYKGPGISEWTLEDVYMETCYVLSGLSRKAGLCLLSIPKLTVSHIKEICNDKTASFKNDEKQQVIPAKEDGVSDLLPNSQENLDMVSDFKTSFSKPTNFEQEKHDIHTFLSKFGSGNDMAANISNVETYKSDAHVATTSCEALSGHKSPSPKNVENPSEDNCTDPCSPSSINDCESSTFNHCDGEALPGTLQNKVDSDEDEYICVTDDEPDGAFSDSKWDTSNDLPLMANVDEVLVTHYVLNLSVNFNAKVMTGDITLFLKPAAEVVLERQFQLCLDCSLVDIESVEEIDLKDDFSVRYYGATKDCNEGPSYSPDVFQVEKHKKDPVALPYTFLPYAVRNWCVRIWKPYKLGRTWPRCVKIKYSTRPEGKSLTWTTNQDRRPCVFSPGAYINNRSLMPCQEPPVAMSTWQAAIHAPRGCTVLMSGNELRVQNSDDGDYVSFLYEMNIPLPCSTLALAIGWFECRQTTTVALSSIIPCRVFSAESTIDDVSEELLPRCKKYVSAACELLGSYPFTRMDLVILPRCFACMGLMSPNMAFLSQSILARDGTMCTRVAHEISHTWFGLLIGAKDWSEEWLSEGFATYMEERILCKVEGWTGDEELFYVELCQILKHRTLLAEFQHADENMQRLRPKLPSVVTAAEAVRQSMEKEKCPEKKSADDIVPHTTVTNGQVCSKKWTQIYYLKGYFLLHHMSSLVGVANFDNFLKEYVLKYAGQLVNSEEFFDYFERRFTSLREENIKDQLIKEWLDRHGLPKHVPKKIGSPGNYLINEVESEFSFWKKTDAANKRRKTQHIRTKKPIKDHPKVNGQTQLVVLLERLLERDAMAIATLTQLDNCYHFADKNAEVRHRWCELVVKHSYYPGYPQVKKFLIEDQGMGIYLFGELLISQQPKQKQLVLDVLSIIDGEMDQCTLKTVQDMLEGRD
ncbi:uncharacterized protein LOC114521309 isoform X2 [Dendronephthya gigantea]|nr:uncharacterized protein LOC114521309 isoform X2 [Dendronephthya gigantea]